MNKKRFFWHLFPYFIGVILISITVVTWLTSKSIRQYYLDDTANELQIRARMLAEQLISQVMLPVETVVDQACKRAGKLSATRVTIILPNGEVIGDSHAQPSKMDNHANRPEIIDALNRSTGMSIRFSRTLNQNMMYVAIPLIAHNDLIGALRTSMSISKIDANLAQIKKRTLLGAVITTLFVAGISLFISRRISRPVEEIKKGAASYARGKFDFKIISPEVEELDSLASALNQMADRLDERIKTIVRQRNEMEAVLTSMVEGVIAVDKNENIIFCNPTTARLFNRRLEDITGRSLYHLVRSQNLQRFVAEAIASDLPGEGDVDLFLDKERTFRIHSTPLRDADGNHIGTLFVLDDVTQTRQLENMRRDFAINVSHEIRTPLTAIKGFVETLLESGLSPDDQSHRFLTIIDKHVRRLEAIVNDLKSLSHLEMDDEQHGITLKVCNIADIIETTVQTCRDKAESKNIRLEWRCDPNVEAPVNPQLLERALANLIDNAINYSSAMDVVKVDAHAADTGIAIRVTDTGIGIAQKHQARVFERFFRADKGRSRESGGTGLGLALVKHIILAHGGTVEVDSTLGKGSCFSIHLPKQ